jgi:hypothetical protein
MALSAPRTNGTDAEIIAYLQQNWLKGIHTATQSPIRYSCTTWQRHLPPSLGPGVLALPGQLGGTVSRADLAGLAQAGTKRQALRRLFVASLMWGRGQRNARLHSGWGQAFVHPALDRTLASTARLVREGRPGDAYRA